MPLTDTLDVPLLGVGLEAVNVKFVAEQETCTLTPLRLVPAGTGIAYCRGFCGPVKVARVVMDKIVRMTKLK